MQLGHMDRQESAVNNMSGLAADLLAWVGNVAGGEVLYYRRHAARREAWEIGVSTRNGEQKVFLRIDRALAAGCGSTRNLRRETALIQALEKELIPTQAILGWNDRHCAALQSWLPGSGALDQAPRVQQHQVLMEFMEILARLHRVDIDQLDLPEFVRPISSLEHSLLEIEAIEELELHPRSACVTDPLCAFGKRWLIHHAPTTVQATVLLQGDTGPGNFMYDENGVTAIMDWEWAHYGDPMEDLGNIWLRDFLTPSSGGDLRPYFEHYARCSGFSLDHDRIRYYLVHQLVRSAITLHYLTRELDWRTAVPLNLGYRAMIDLEACAAMAQFSGQQRRQVTTLADPALQDSIQQTLARQIEQMVVPHLEDPFTAQLAQGHVAVLHYLALQSEHQADVEAAELDSLKQLLGSRVDSLSTGREELLQHIMELQAADEAPVLDHLYAQALNQAALMAPLIQPWVHHRWATI